MTKNKKQERIKTMEITEPRTDCFAWNRETRKCKALNYNVCACEGNCPFFKTPEQYREDRLRAEKLLAEHVGIKTE